MLSHCGAGFLVFKAWNSLLPLLQKFVLFTQQIFTNFLPYAGLWRAQRDESDMGLVHECCRQVEDGFAVGRAQGAFPIKCPGTAPWAARI